jgi:predicted MPP superfamily phosphohydrolase
MGFDAALCGHLHGLQVRLPVVGGIPLLASRYFPQADAGLYHFPGIQVYISRGLARQPGLRGLRINNPPELSVLTFVRGK